MQDQYRRVEDEYFKLRGQLAIGRITREQFESSLHALMVTDTQGRSWMLGTETGKWHVYNGTQWVPADPFVPGSPPAPTTQPPTPFAGPAPTPAPVSTPSPPAKSGGGCGRVLVLGCLALVIACVLVGGGGYLALATGTLSTSSLLGFVGLGPATIGANNLRDESVRVDVEQLDAAEDSSPAQTSLLLDAYDIKSGSLANAGRYLVTLSLVPDETVIGTCTLRLHSGDEVQFVILPDKIVVHRPDDPPTTGADLVVESSMLCRAP